MCADEQLSSKREPYFPGNYEWAPGGGGGGREMVTGREGGRAHFSTKDLFSISRGVVRYQLLSQT